jgi:hypothetical protein
MKLLGGDWSRGDVLTLVTIFVAVVSMLVAHFDVPKLDVPKLDAPKLDVPKPEAAKTQLATSASIATIQPSHVPTPGIVEVSPGNFVGDVISGEVGVECGFFADAETSKIHFDRPPIHLVATAKWVDTEHFKNPNQSVEYEKDYMSRTITDVYAKGVIWGETLHDNCPQGRGTLTLHVTWSEEKPSQKPTPKH